jgi:hypothetical protein
LLEASLKKGTAIAAPYNTLCCDNEENIEPSREAYNHLLQNYHHIYCLQNNPKI